MSVKNSKILIKYQLIGSINFLLHKTTKKKSSYWEILFLIQPNYFKKKFFVRKKKSLGLVVNFLKHKILFLRKKNVNKWKKVWNLLEDELLGKKSPGLIN